MITPTYNNFNECVETPMEFPALNGNKVQQDTPAEVIPERELSFKMYPNPANDWVAIELPLSVEGANITIVDLQGRVILQTKTNIPLFIWETYNLTEGMYIVNITNADGTEKIGTQKIIIQH